MDYVYTAIGDHIADRNNPHNLIKEEVGLRYVYNYPVAKLEESEEGKRNDRYITPRQLKAIFNGYLKEKGLMTPSGDPIPPSSSGFTGGGVPIGDGPVSIA